MILKTLELFWDILGVVALSAFALVAVGFIGEWAITRFLRFTKGWTLFVRFMWLDAKVKHQMRADMEYEERKRNEPYVPPPYDEEDYDSEGELRAAIADVTSADPPPPSEDHCHPLTSEVPLTTMPTPDTLLMEAAATAYDVGKFSAPFGSDEGVLDSDKTEAAVSELPEAEAPPARKDAEVIDACSVLIFELLVGEGHMLPKTDLREVTRSDIAWLISDLRANTPRRSPEAG